jgi:hypothetical protein
VVKTFDDTQARKLASQGRLREAALLLEAMLGEDPECDQTALALARIYMRAGHIRRAQALLAGRPSYAAAPLLTLIFRLEEQWTRLLTDFDLAAVRECAQELCREIESMSGTDVERLSARAIAARIDCAAATYFELTSAQKEELSQRLGEIGEGLIAARDIDQGYNALVNASVLQTLEGDLSIALQDLSERMRRLARDDLAADALIRLARARLKLGSMDDSVFAPLHEVERISAALEHDVLPLDVAHVSAKLRIDRHGAPLSELEDVALAYRQRDLPAREFDALADLSSFAHQMGEVTEAERYRLAEVAVAGRAGLIMTLANAALGEADLLTRSRATSEAVAICKDHLAKSLPRAIRGSFHHVMASAYGFSGDSAESRKAIDEALRLFGEAGALELQSTTATSYLNDQHQDAPQAVLNDLTDWATHWIAHDVRCGLIENAAAKYELLAAIHMRQFKLSLASVTPSLWRLDEAERCAARADQLADTLTGKARARHTGNVHQTRTQIALFKGAWRDAVAHLHEAEMIYGAAGLHMEAANSAYLAGKVLTDTVRRGASRHGGSNTSDVEYLIEADTALARAHGYYKASGMRSEMARALLARAEVRSMARFSVPTAAADDLRLEALAFLSDAEALLDKVRDQFQGDTTIRALKGRRAAVEESVPIYGLTVQLLAEQPSDLADLWNCHQRSRGRALGDVLARQPLRTAGIEARFATRPDILQLLDKEQSLVEAIQKARGAKEREKLRGELDGVHVHMAQLPELGDIIHLQSGFPPRIETMQALLGAAPERPVYVDWVVAGNRIGLMATTSGGIQPVRWLEGPASTVPGLTGMIAALGREIFREADAERKLAAFSQVLAPLKDLTRPGEHLILSPSGPLLQLPLHAIALDGGPLLARNPVSYCASAQLLHTILARPSTRGNTTVRIFADPTSDSPASLSIGRELARTWGTRLAAGPDATTRQFRAALSQAGIVHFQGHAGFNELDPLRSHLDLSDGPLTVADILSGLSSSGGLVVLVACGAGASLQAAGDEPMGLPVGLLLAGSNSVIAPVWPVHEDEAAEFSAMLHSALRSNRGQTLAEVLRSVQLKLLSRSPPVRFQAWAPYVLHGSWR